MKNKRIIQILGSAILIASIGITGCNAVASKDTEKETTEETTEKETTTEDEEEDHCCCVVDEDYDDEIYYSSTFLSTNGELPGQMDYMIPYPENADWDQMPEEQEDWLITDLSSIEDDDIRALAQSYQDDGYNINDPALEVEFGCTCGDAEYIFANGFSCYRDAGDIYSYVYAYKMNEDLFDYYFVEWYGYDDPSVSCTDDGTVIRYGYDDNYVEFNRETGIGLSYSSCDNS